MMPTEYKTPEKHETPATYDTLGENLTPGDYEDLPDELLAEIFTNEVRQLATTEDEALRDALLRIDQSFVMQVSDEKRLAETEDLILKQLHLQKHTLESEIEKRHALLAEIKSAPQRAFLNELKQSTQNTFHQKVVTTLKPVNEISLGKTYLWKRVLEVICIGFLAIVLYMGLYLQGLLPFLPIVSTASAIGLESWALVSVPKKIYDISKSMHATLIYSNIFVLLGRLSISTLSLSILGVVLFINELVSLARLYKEYQAESLLHRDSPDHPDLHIAKRKFYYKLGTTAACALCAIGVILFHPLIIVGTVLSLVFTAISTIDTYVTYRKLLLERVKSYFTQEQAAKEELEKAVPDFANEYKEKAEAYITDKPINIKPSSVLATTLGKKDSAPRNKKNSTTEMQVALAHPVSSEFKQTTSTSSASSSASPAVNSASFSLCSATFRMFRQLKHNILHGSDAYKDLERNGYSYLKLRRS